MDPRNHLILPLPNIPGTTAYQVPNVQCFLTLPIGVKATRNFQQMPAWPTKQEKGWKNGSNLFVWSHDRLSVLLPFLSLSCNPYLICTYISYIRGLLKTRCFPSSDLNHLYPQFAFLLSPAISLATDVVTPILDLINFPPKPRYHLLNNSVGRA